MKKIKRGDNLQILARNKSTDSTGVDSGAPGCLCHRRESIPALRVPPLFLSSNLYLFCSPGGIPSSCFSIHPQLPSSSSLDPSILFSQSPLPLPSLLVLPYVPTSLYPQVAYVAHVLSNPSAPMAVANLPFILLQNSRTQKLRTWCLPAIPLPFSFRHAPCSQTTVERK